MKDILKVNTLVFEGGSVKGLAYVGALEALHQQTNVNGTSLLNQIEHVSGTSAGSIVALLVALGLNLNQIKYVMDTTNFSRFEDVSSFYAYGRLGKGAAIYRNGYLCEGQAFMGWVRALIKQYTGSEETTFAQLREMHRKDLHVYAVRINDSQVITFNADKTPEMSVALAVRMSMSIPIFFKPVRVHEEINSDGEVTNVRLDEKQGTTYYVDGGVKANYPYQQTKERLNLDDNQMLGFRVDSHYEKLGNLLEQPEGRYFKAVYREKLEIKDGYGRHLFSPILTALMSSQDDVHRSNADELSRTINCWDCQVSTFDFHLTEVQKEALLASGVHAAIKFLSTQEEPVSLPFEELLSSAESNKEAVNDQGFVKGYMQTQEKWLAGIANEMGLNESQSVVQDEEHLNYLKNLSEDMHRIRRIENSIVISGAAGDINTRIANVDDVSDSDFEEAMRHVQSLVDKGIQNKVEIKDGASAGAVVTDIGNIAARQGFFKQVNDTRFMSKAEKLLDELNNNPSYADKASSIQRLNGTLKRALQEYNTYENTISEPEFKNSIRRYEDARAEVIQITHELSKEIEKVRGDTGKKPNASSPGVNF